MLGIALLAAPAAGRGLGFAPCGQPQGIVCATVTVPLDRSGTIPGSVGIVVEKKPATSGTSSGAVFYLTGGPGDAGTAATLGVARHLAPELETRDLYVIDYRGVGLSGALRCRSAPDWPRCAEELGPKRHLYTTRDIVEDLEAARSALGLDRISIFGISYGTKIAQGYALRYGDRVERLVLDSVVPVNGWDALNGSSYRSIGRVLREICAAGRCRGITPDPVADVAELAARMVKTPLAVAYVQPNGAVVRATFEAIHLYNVLSAGNVVFDGVSRARWPAAVRSALQGDPFPLGRLRFVYKELRASHGPQAYNPVAWRATKCEDLDSPWRGAVTSEERQQRVVAAVNALPARTFHPFPRSVVLFTPDVRDCIVWPEAPDPPVVKPAKKFTGPTLVLSGTQDTRTPLEDARVAAKLFPRSTLLAVPDMGHAPYGDVHSPACVRRALEGFFAGRPVAACRPGRPFYPPQPVAPTSLASLAPWPGVAGLPGKALRAVLETVDDVHYTSNSYGALVGLRGGTFTVSGATARMKGIVYVPGVVVSGVFDLREGTGTLTVAGSGARGALTLTRDRVSGTLGGAAVSVPYVPLHFARADPA